MYSVAVIGAKGYSGSELCKLLLTHPKIKNIDAYASKSEGTLNHYLIDNTNYNVEKKAAAIKINSIKNIKNNLHKHKYDVLFFATPHEVSLELIPQFINSNTHNTHNTHIIDLSGAFRLDAEDYLSWYGFQNNNKTLCEEAIYGLIPWNKEKIASITKNKKRLLIANPGCFPTSILMILLPLIKENLLDPSFIVIDSKSGVTGAGRKPNEHLIFSEISENFFPYKVAKHQHFPEINKYLIYFNENNSEINNIKDINILFTTHLLPIRRGILTSVYAKIKDLSFISSNKDEYLKKIENIFNKYYQNYPLVNHQPIYSSNQIESQKKISLKNVVCTNKNNILYHIDSKGNFYGFSLIDNLLKGAASQAIENFNLIMNLPSNTGLI